MQRPHGCRRRRDGQGESNEVEEALCALVAPWLLDAEIDTLEVQETCGCYSEYTTEPPTFYVTFRATHDDEQKLSRLIAAIEPLVKQWAMSHYSFSGCSCCCEDGDTDNVSPSTWVRVIRRKGAD